MFCFSLQPLFKTFVTVISIWWAELQVCLHIKCLLLFSHFNQNWGMSQILVKLPISNFMKIHSVVFKFLHADRLTDRCGKADRHIFASFHCKHTKDEHQDYAKNAFENCAAKLKFVFLLLLFGYVCEMAVQSISL
jgi:hypothetical protein